MPAYCKKVDTEKVRDLMVEYDINTLKDFSAEIGISRPSLTSILRNGRGSDKFLIGLASLVRRKTGKRVTPNHFVIPN